MGRIGMALGIACLCMLAACGRNEPPTPRVSLPDNPPPPPQATPAPAPAPAAAAAVDTVPTVLPLPLAGSAVNVAQGRNGYTAVLLPNGKVLIVGGRDSDNRAATAQIFDPDTDTRAAPGSALPSLGGAAVTQLADGRVLIAGGLSNEAAQSIEIYDPATGEIAATASLDEPRAYASATLLKDGRVLIAGGTRPPSVKPGYTGLSPKPLNLGVPGTPLASAEIFDPATGKVSKTGSLAQARVLHTATLLDNGRVLFAGGEGNYNQRMASAELYDPASGRFSATGSLSAPRSHHTASRLNNGRVLIAGGRMVVRVKEPGGGSVYVTRASETAELYDPASGKFAATGKMANGHSDHTATRLRDGRVLIAGGCYGEPTNTAELYDRRTGKFTQTKGMHDWRCGHSATLLPNGTVLVAGGENTYMRDDGFLNTTELFNPKTGEFSPGGRLTHVRTNHSALLLKNGKVLVMGGIHRDGPADQTEILDPANYSSGSPNLLAGRYGITAAMLKDGRVLLAGGADGEVHAEAVIFDPATSTFSMTGSMNVARWDAEAVTLDDGRVLIAGGMGGDTRDFMLDSAELYNPKTGAFISIKLTSARAYFAMVKLPDDAVLLAGGVINEHNHPGWSNPPLGPYVPGGPQQSAEIFDPRTNTSRATGGLTTAMGRMTGTRLPNGKVLVAGGGTFQGYAVRGFELYDPAKRKFTLLSKLPADPYWNRVILLPQGRLLLTGGTPVLDIYDSATGKPVAAYQPAGIGAIRDIFRLKDGRFLIIGASGAMIATLPLSGAAGPH